MIGFALTEEQFSTLLKMVYIANTIANSPEEAGFKRRDFEEIEEYIFARAKGTFPMAVFEHKVGEVNHSHPSLMFENDPDVNSMMDQYEEYAVKYVISEKLAEQEIEGEFGLHSKDKMSAEQYEQLIIEKSQKYEELLNKHGLKILEVNKKYLN